MRERARLSQCRWVLLHVSGITSADSNKQIKGYTRDVQKVLQLLYKKEPQTFKHSVIFEYSLLQHQCSFVTFLLSCLFLVSDTNFGLRLGFVS